MVKVLGVAFLVLLGAVAAVEAVTGRPVVGKLDWSEGRVRVNGAVRLSVCMVMVLLLLFG